MDKLSAQARRSVPVVNTGNPPPLSDRSQAQDVKARASEMYQKGDLSKSELSKIYAKANKVLAT